MKWCYAWMLRRINPSDLILLLAGADANELASSGTAERPVLTGRVRSTTGLAGRVGQALPVGNEGRRYLSSKQAPPPAAQALLVGWSRRHREEACMPSTACCAADQCFGAARRIEAVDGASACINR